MRTIQQNLISMVKEHTVRKRLAVVVCMIAIATIFAVFWSLRINGITLANAEPSCGMEEHIHTDACYDWVATETDGTEEIEETESTEEIEETIEISETAEDEAAEEDTVSCETDEDAESAAGTEAGEDVTADTEEGTESVAEETEEVGTEDATEELTEEETESPQPGDIRVVDGVTYVYELVCGKEEHTHTDECYESDDSEGDEDEDEVDAASLTAGVAAIASYGVSAASADDDESGIATVSDEDETDTTTTTTTTTSSNDASDYYLATTVNGVPSDGTYIIYTYDETNEKYYVVNTDGTLTECSEITSVSAATGTRPYYVTSTGTIVYGSEGESDYEDAQWIVAQDSSDSSAYTIANSSATGFLAASGSSEDVTITTGFSSNTGSVTLSGDFTLTYTFYNKSSGSKNWENFVLEMVSNGVYLDVRADNYGWTTLDDADNGVTYLDFGTGSSDWDAWNAAMAEGQLCTVTVIRTDTSITVTTTANGETFTAKNTDTVYAADEELTIYITGEACTIRDVLYMYTTDGGKTYESNLSTTDLIASESGYVTLDSSDSVTNGVEITRGDIVAVISDSLTGSWEVGETATVFYFAAVQESADNYHFTEMVTLADAAAKQEESYVVYTKIGDTYYIVSAVDGSLLECTDISSYDKDSKALLSAGTGVYIWDKDSYDEPVFKFTTADDDSGTDAFENYRWTLSSSDADNTTGTGSYTIYNKLNDNYLAAGLAINKDSIVQYGDTTSIEITSGAAVFQITDTNTNSHTSGGQGYVIDLYIYSADESSYIRYRITGYNGGAASGAVRDSSGVSYTAYSMGTSEINDNDELTITVIRAENSIYISFENITKGSSFIQIFDNVSGLGDITDSVSMYLYSAIGTYTVVSEAIGLTSSSNSLTDASYPMSDDNTTLEGIDETKLSLAGDFDVTYSFANKSSSKVDASTASDDELAAAATDNYAIVVTDGTNYIYVQANDYGFTATSTNGTITKEESALTFYTDSSDYNDWVNFVTAMQAGATCTVRAVRTGDTFYFLTTAAGTGTGSGTFSCSFASCVFTTGFSDTEDISIYLAGENCTISEITITDNTARNYTSDYNRISSTETTLTITAVEDENSNTESTSETWYWNAGVIGSYSEEFSLIGQLAPDTVDTAEIDWVTGTAADSTATGTATTTVAGETVATLASTGSLTITFSLARVKEYTIHFDPTNGGTTTYAGSTVQYYEDTSATTTTAAAAGSYAMKSYSDAWGDCYYILPTATSGNYYPYTLAGWYDIYNGLYYAAPTENTSISVSDTTVFYADWAISNTQYVDGTEDDVIESLDTSSFITTKVFDYNDLFNIYSSYFTDGYVSGSDTYYSYVNASAHREIWSFVSGANSANVLMNRLGTSLGFLFYSNRSSNSSLPTSQGEGTLSYVAGRNNSYGTVFTQGIVSTIQSAKGVDIRDILFSESGSFVLGSTADISDSSGYLGVNYLGEGNYLYQYDSDSGYYYFDSSKNAAFYSGERFYLYEYTVKVDRTSSRDDFLPFNYNQVSSGEVRQYWTNYWFGMNSEIEFYLPDDVGEYNDDTNSYGNQSTKETDMIFRFMGDDDVWVYVDDVIVLDLGGVHGAIYGEVDFSTDKIAYITNTDPADSDSAGTATVTCAQLCFDRNSAILQYDTNVVYEEDGKLYIYVTGYQTSSVATVSSDTSGATKIEVGYTTTYTSTGASKDSGSHTLNIYYMERGGSESNAAIWTNLSSATYNLTLAKEDEEENEYGTQAVFEFYTDEDFTDTASLAKELNGDDDYYSFTSSETVYDMREGVTYYVKETTAPNGLTASGYYFTVCLKSGVLTITVYDSSGTATDTYVYTLTVAWDDTSQSYVCTIDYNPEASTTDWKYVKQSSVDVTPAVSSSGTVTYYDIGFTIVNTAAYELPSTGSIGIARYLITGETLLVIALIGLMTIAFYQFVWIRKFGTMKNNKKYTKEKSRRSKRFAEMRGHPRERSVTRGHARDRPGDR